MAQNPSRFHLQITGAARAAQVIPVHSAHTASMIAQASRVPRLAGLGISTAKPAAASRGKGGKR